jgi:hypothetical protein
MSRAAKVKVPGTSAAPGLPNTTPPPRSARPSLSYTLYTTQPAVADGVSMPRYGCWRSGRIVLHRGIDTPRDVVGAVEVGGKAWRVVVGTSEQVKAWALRCEAAVEATGADAWAELDAAPAPLSNVEASARMSGAFAGAGAASLEG